MTLLTSKGNTINCFPFKKPFINVDLTLIKTSSQGRHILAVNMAPMSSFLPQAAETKYTFQLSSGKTQRSNIYYFTVYGHDWYVDLITE